eukprot:CAMPEP_0206411264 /NCGR_PEP_ID=MMETSP0294-20121207/33155_1 /ASSEMBLY_ACC=CAM_ASM_000327 /TAXON_ID=39354 /ORGANISM="Heterosigma akashiwo, Strain CCMP2393" /LENGTH=81 /DNA_ID=CAMNT_0053871909 /DNA_START=89 /DNA_END=331 /DNA_ORIENTATION=-
MMGHENSYLAMIPFIAWNVDPSLGRQLLTLWAIGYYICNYLRDLLVLPRPPHFAFGSLLGLGPRKGSKGAAVPVGGGGGGG